MTGRAHDYAPFATSGYHLTGYGLNNLKIGQDVNVQRPLNQRAIGLKKILLFFLVGRVAYQKVEWTVLMDLPQHRFERRRCPQIGPAQFRRITGSLELVERLSRGLVISRVV